MSLAYGAGTPCHILAVASHECTIYPRAVLLGGAPDVMVRRREVEVSDVAVDAVVVRVEDEVREVVVVVLRWDFRHRRSLVPSVIASY